MRLVSHVSEAYKRYVLGALTLVYTLNYLDRGLIILLLQPIKDDLHLSDTQLGLLTGIAFGLFYATLGIPIARWADRGNRVTITSLAIGLWGCTVMLCALVTNFAQLVAARIAAAVGEAGCMPPTYSLVGDYFSGSAARARAMAVYMLASPLSALLSFIVGGWLNTRHSWRTTFFLMGIPGLAVALLVKWTIVEPRTRAGAERVAVVKLPRMTVVLRVLWERRATRHLSAAIILLFTMGAGLGPWYAAFMIRVHGMNTADLGVWLGLIFGLGGILGIALGGYVAGRWFSDNDRGQMRLSAALIALQFPCFIAFLLSPNKYAALLALVPVWIIFSFILAPSFSLMQRLVVEEMRATTLAVVMLFGNLIGMGVGPEIVGVLSDSLRPMAGNDSLRYAMLLVSFIALWASWHFWIAGRTVAADLTQLPHGGPLCAGGLQ
jgi:MFS family permease